VAATPIKVLIVDDSAIVRKLLADGLKGEPDIEVVGGAGDPFVARDMILRLEPDVLTLDIEMSRMDGLSFLRRLMTYRPMPVIVVSSLTQSGSAATIDAIRAGAVDVLAKPGGSASVGELAARLKQRLRAIKSGQKRNGILAIGASTGGPLAIESVLTRMPGETPPIVIAQHMPAGFTKALAERLDGMCALRVVEAAGGEQLEPGTAYLAPGEHHLVVQACGTTLTTALHDGPPVHHQRPAVDELFFSLAKLRGVPIVAALLTGMGSDGADGLLALRQAGAETIAEDEQSCIVFGMPREAIARGAAMHVATLLRMPMLIPECFERLAVGSRQ
jgi:two-component system, chemotaxis family, protein-glutamate methylesterase/glutaminase